MGSEMCIRDSRSIYRDLNIRLKPFVQKLNVVAVVASQGELEQEKARTDRILELSRYLLIVTIVLLLGGIWFLVLFVGRNQAKRKIAQLEHEINLEAIDQLPVGIAFYDSDNKLVRTNRCYRELYQLPEHLVRTGTPLEAVIRHWAGMNIYGEVEDIDEVVKARVRANASSVREPYSIEHNLPNGRTIQVQGRNLTGGGAFGIYTDVTENRRAEEEKRENWIESLLEQEDRIEELENQMGLETLAHVGVGISIIDADLKIVHNNSDVNEIYGFPDSLTQSGQPFKMILLKLAEWGVYGDGDPEKLVSNLVASFLGPWSEWRDDIKLPSGKVIDVRVHKLSGGGLAYVHTDVTEEREAQRILETTDKVTGLPTFEYLEQQLAEILDDAKKRNTEFYGMRIKVDRFQAINEIYSLSLIHI